MPREYHRECRAHDCGKPFTSDKAPQRYCSERCEKRVAAQRRRAKEASGVEECTTCPERSRDRMDCQSYLACLDIAARKDARWVCSRGCTRYQPALVVLSVPVRSNWQIESAGVSNRRASEATEEDRREYVRSKEQRPIGSQVPMPWRLVG